MTYAHNRGSTERLLGFSDALFAIAITFLALDLGTLPKLESNDDVVKFLADHWIEYAVYFATFLLVGFIWWRHRLVFRNITQRSPGITWLNLIILALVAMLPYPSGLVALGGWLGISLVLLLAPLVLISLCLWGIWELARRQRLLAADVGVDTVHYIRGNLVSTLVIFSLALTVAAVSWALESRTWYLVAIAVLGLLLVSPFVLGRMWPKPQTYAAQDLRIGQVDTGSAGHLDAGDEETVNSGDTLPDLGAAERPGEGKLAGARTAVLSVLDKERLESESLRFMIFSDGVFAISVTILALQLQPPELEGTPTTHEILSNVNQTPWWPYLITFMLIGIFWIRHAHAFDFIARQDTILLWLNLITLMFVAFLPLPSELMQRYEFSDEGIASLLFYMSTLTAVSVSMVAIRLYSIYAPGVEFKDGSGEDSRTGGTVRAVWFSGAFVLATALIAITHEGSFALVLPLFALARRPVLYAIGRREWI